MTLPTRRRDRMVMRVVFIVSELLTRLTASEGLIVYPRSGWRTSGRLRATILRTPKMDGGGGGSGFGGAALVTGFTTGLDFCAGFGGAAMTGLGGVGAVVTGCA